ncbi:MAG: sugar phosphate nucleotidyltransferase, partial [Gemmatimonadota bacterium]|nr:sugar phosphate nucleotidyltransferase [Gemmatimonadota bacterium]
MRWGSQVETDLSRLKVSQGASLLDALRVIDRGAESIAFVTDASDRVVGTVTDGDIRRALINGKTTDSCCLAEVMRKDFASVTPTTGRAEVLDLMRARDIGQLPIIDSTDRLIGLHTIGQMISTAARPNPAVILAGGRGTRLGALTASLPKPMIVVAGRPILERLILHLMSCGIREFHLSVNYLAEVIESHFGDGSAFGCSITYLRESSPLGTGGPLSLLDPVPNLPVVVVNGDLVTQCDVGRMLDFHEAGGYVATIAGRPTTITSPFGVLRTDGNELLEIREKPSEQVLINAGLYIISPEIVPLVPKGKDHPITDLLADCLSAKKKVG